MQDKVVLSFDEISRRLKYLDLPQADRVVGIATGGIVPAAMLAHQMDKPLGWLNINFRDDSNHPRHARPRLLDDAPQFAAGERILLVDDVSVSGATLNVAKAVLSDQEVITLVLKGQADLVLFPEVSACAIWPWKLGRKDRSW
jgi:hypoxanthine phosphoribosyltransferase